jgi:hypothetical protein
MEKLPPEHAPFAQEVVDDMPVRQSLSAGLIAEHRDLLLSLSQSLREIDYAHRTEQT